MVKEKDGYRPVIPDPIYQTATRIIKGVAAPSEKIIRDHDVLVQLITHMRAMGSRIVFTSGVWDLFHIGHAEYLLKSKQEGCKQYPDADQIILVVGADTDALTKERKGPSRPRVPEDERFELIAHLGVVDIVTPQYEQNQLYTLIEHDVRIISTSTKDFPKDVEKIRRQCDHLINLPPQSETSTSARIRMLILDGRLGASKKVRERIPQIIRNLEELVEEIEHDPSVE